MKKYIIEINNKELSTPENEKLLRELIDKFIIENKIITLKKIVFTDNWNEELTEYQKEHNIPVEYTDSQYGSASGKTLKIKDKDIVQNVVFFRKEILMSIISQQGYGILLLYHELSHIYYYEKVGNMLDYLKIKNKIDFSIKEEFKDFGLSMWEEYFVSRFLCKYLLGSTDCFIGILIEEYKKIKIDMEQEIIEYRYSDDINKLYNSARQKIKLISIYSAYSCGMINAFNINENELYNEVHEILKVETGLVDIWERMYKIYNEIYMMFPNFKNIDSELIELSSLFIELYNHFGIFIEELDTGDLYISVPL